MDVETALIEGEPAEVLLRQTDEARLLVVGSRGYGPLRRVLLGSVSSAVVAHAACPVIVVPRGSGKEAGADELREARQSARAHLPA